MRDVQFEFFDRVRMQECLGDKIEMLPMLQKIMPFVVASALGVAIGLLTCFFLGVSLY